MDALKSVLVAFPLLAAATLFAADVSAAGPCPHIRDPYWCNQNPECFWDNDDQRCETRQSESGYCASRNDPYWCNQTPGCFWDNDDQRCESR